MQDKTRILAVDDEPRYLRAIQFNLEASGYQVLTAGAGQPAIDVVANQTPDLVLLDVRMPEMNGLQVCRRIREFSAVPIIMLTALAESADIVAGLEAGADDYVTTPFNAETLIARVRAVLRRASFSNEPASPAAFQTGDLRVDFSQRRVFVRGAEVKLTSTEYRLLCELIRQAGQVLVPDHLLDKVWGTGYVGDSHVVWQAVHRLRHKIEPDPQHPQYIQTRPGIGYIFVRPDEE